MPQIAAGSTEKLPALRGFGKPGTPPQDVSERIAGKGAPMAKIGEGTRAQR
jgi:hypothetical protein